MDDQFVRVPRKRRGRFGAVILNLLTLVVLAAIVGVIGVFALIFLNPQVGFNPFPPPTLPVLLGTPTATYTPAVPLGATWTPKPTLTVAPTDTVVPTDTPTPEPTATPVPQPPFAVQPGNPVRIPNVANEDGCNWMGVGGQVFNLENDPIVNLGVHLEGTLDGEPVSLDAVTGSATNLGPSGYVFNLATEPIASENTIWVQLNDGAGNSLSEQVFITTMGVCDVNNGTFVMVNFRQVREQ
jgi:hypothetical protein